MCKNCPEGTHRRTKAKKNHNLPRPFGEARYILVRVITGDEIWVYQNDPETKRQSAQWKNANSPRPKNFRQSKSRVKIMLLIFLILGGFFIMNLYQVDKQSTKFTIWKYWKGCVKKLDLNDPKFLPTTHGSCITKCTCSHGTVCEGVFSY